MTFRPKAAISTTLSVRFPDPYKVTSRKQYPVKVIRRRNRTLLNCKNHNNATTINFHNETAHSFRPIVHRRSRSSGRRSSSGAHTSFHFGRFLNSREPIKKRLTPGTFTVWFMLERNNGPRCEGHQTIHLFGTSFRPIERAEADPTTAEKFGGPSRRPLPLVWCVKLAGLEGLELDKNATNKMTIAGWPRPTALPKRPTRRRLCRADGERSTPSTDDNTSGSDLLPFRPGLNWIVLDRPGFYLPNLESGPRNFIARLFDSGVTGERDFDVRTWIAISPVDSYLNNSYRVTFEKL